MEPALLVYVAGMIVGAWRTDGSLSARTVHALLWPIGPLAFAVTISILLAASLIAFPWLALAALAAAALTGWWMAAAG